MAYESAADEMVFIVGPFLVGLLATAIAPWVAIAGAAVLTLVFVTAVRPAPDRPARARRAEHAARQQAPARELVRSRCSPSSPARSASASSSARP